MHGQHGDTNDVADMDIVRDFGQAARRDEALMGDLIRVMTGFLKNEEDGIVEWEMDTEAGTLMVGFSTGGSEACLFTEGGDEIILEDGLRGELEREADRIMDEAKADAEEGIEGGQAIRDTAEALWRWR